MARHTTTERARWRRRLAALAATAALSAHGTAHAAGVPHLGERGQQDYAAYRDAPAHRAFAIAPGGAWAWRAGLASAEQAQAEALRACRVSTPQTCVPYARDDEVVFDAQAWPKLWGPYAGAPQARRASPGTARGQRFPNLALRDPEGRPVSIERLQGRVLVLHFWGSWCAPCRREMPELQALARALAARRDVAFVLVQVREPIARSRAWIVEQGLRLPLYDSGVAGDLDDQLHLAGGGRLSDRTLASVFPSTYVLDKRGMVLFAHSGPVPHWDEYRAFIEHAATYSGR